MFSYKGDIILSKSWLNRAQVVYHYAGQSFPFHSDAEDVKNLQNAIQIAGKPSEYHLGQGGTSFRFFVFLISRVAGTWKVNADSQLLARPQESLVHVLNQMGVSCRLYNGYFEIESKGWSVQSPVTCDAQLSSQFISGLLLSAWSLPVDLQVRVPTPVKSEDYLNMTLQILEMAGMKIQVTEAANEKTFLVYKNQSPVTAGLFPEADVSSAFSLAAAAVVNGSAEITNWPQHTLQPDRDFLKVFQQMNIQFKVEESTLKVGKHNTWSGCELNIGHAPDLFPVLSALCALGEGKSKLFGAEHLKVKESDRIAKTAELLKLCGVRYEELNDGLVIYGRSYSDKLKPVTFDPGHDHRMAMAAGLFKLAGFNIEILDKDCVRKSYPDFWKDTAL